MANSHCGKIWIYTFLFTLAFACQDSEKAQFNSPNIVFILADDLTFRDIGCYGSPDVHTPHIDQLAAEGLRFTQCFQAAPMCSPTRHNILTGLYPVKSGAYPNHTYARETNRSLVHYLTDQGYRMGLTGKRHIAPESVFPFEYLSTTKRPQLDSLEKFMTRDPSQPFCSFVCYREPHSPGDLGDHERYDPDSISLPPYLVDTEETRQRLIEYFAEITYLDSCIGEVLTLIDAHHLRSNTLVMFASEQGNAFPFAKWTCYDSGLQSALIARWPGHIAAGATTAAMVEYVDIAPTFIELAGGDAIPILDGTSFASVLFGVSNTHKQLVYGVQTTRGISNGPDHYGIRSVRSSRYKYIRNLTPEVIFTNNLTEGSAEWASFWPTWIEKAEEDANADWLVSRFQQRPQEEFYNVIDDPYELHNLIDDSLLISEVSSHRLALHSWMESQGDQGQATEMEAHHHQTKFLKKVSK